MPGNRISESYKYILNIWRNCKIVSVSSMMVDFVSILLGHGVSRGLVKHYSQCFCERVFFCCCCSVTKSCPVLCDPMDCSMLGSSVLHYFSEFAQTHVHWVSDAIQPSHPLLPPSPSALNLSQHQGLFQWVGSSHQMAIVLELQHQSFQWIFRVDFL